MARRSAQIEVDGIQRGFMHLDGKASARLGYSFIPSPAPTTDHPRLLVFLGGLDALQMTWQGTLTNLISLSKTDGFNLPPILVYDRYGVGASDHDPGDKGKPMEEYHDAVESMRDLRQLITQVSVKHLGLGERKVQDLRIVFCAHSIGCCIARFYADSYPGTVESLLLIDSAIAGTAAEKTIPNPDIPEEWEKRKWTLPEGITADLCRKAVLKTKRSPFSGYPMTTTERLRWTNMPQLLPSSEKPRLRGPKPHMPLVTVLVNDPAVAVPELAKVSVPLFSLNH
jgi:pimeloyl-ACP methyl ester carboxylesterase